jgi:hypothetical protein
MDVWPYEGSLKMSAAIEQLDEAMDRLDPLAALMAMSRLKDLMPDVAADLCVIASRAGFTNRRIAQALDVSPGTLRGLKEEARA